MTVIRVLWVITVFVCTLNLSSVQAQEGNQHLAIEDPAELTMEEANRIYEELKERLAEGYESSEMKIIAGYQSWKRYNSSPYISATHGQRYINSYANDLGQDYGRLEQGQKYPEGTVFAKDSITVTASGKTFSGALFIMEKLSKGRNPGTGDWRYVVVNPDGSLFGDTVADEPDLVEYCHACHVAKAKDDFVFYVPKAYRTN